MDKTTVIIIIVIILAGFLFWGFQSGFLAKLFAGPGKPVPPTPLPPGIVLFYSPDCPHCQDVEAFIATNNIDQKVKYTKLEVPFNGKTSPELVANAELALQLAQQCKIDVSQGVGIPFLYDGNGKCYLGEYDIPNFLKNEAGIK